MLIYGKYCDFLVYRSQKIFPNDHQVLCQSLNASSLQHLSSRYVIILSYPESVLRLCLPLSGQLLLATIVDFTCIPISRNPIPGSCRPIIQPLSLIDDNPPSSNFWHICILLRNVLTEINQVPKEADAYQQRNVE